jgi:hypothetical protein
VTMRKEVGDPLFPIWLLGDSNPKRWADRLETPFDPRHPIRHNIWTSILDEIQDQVYRSRCIRIDTSRMYIRNAVENPDWKPNRFQMSWGIDLSTEIIAFRQALSANTPVLVLCFGAFSFEFARRSLDFEPIYPVDHWRTKQLGDAFRERMREFSPSAINPIPLLHRSVAGGRFISSHNQFCGTEGGNYFAYVASRIAEELLRHEALLDVWIKRSVNQTET